jgi:hypothetical protein
LAARFSGRVSLASRKVYASKDVKKPKAICFLASAVFP